MSDPPGMLAENAMNICTSFCLLPSAVRRRGKNLWVDGPFGPVEIASLRSSLSYYRGNKLKNGSILCYVKHIIGEIRRILSEKSAWTCTKSGGARITDHREFFELSFRRHERERDLIRCWARETDASHTGAE